jgi:transglutaminase-like putative cysteine protease
MRRIHIEHVTEYAYEQPVRLLTHRLLLRPREGHDLRIESSGLVITPEPSLRWLRDVYGNIVALADFPEPTRELRIASDVVVQHYASPLGAYALAPEAERFPFRYDAAEQVDLQMYVTSVYPGDAARVGRWLSSVWQPGQSLGTLALLDQLNRKIADEIQYEVREEPGVQTPARTLERMRGSCRDMAALFIEGCRSCGLAARFVSGYLLSTSAVVDTVSTHAWSEVYLPGSGWRGFDSTSGQHVDAEHVAVAVHRHAEAIPPVAGSYLGPAEPRPTLRVHVRAQPI